MVSSKMTHDWKNVWYLQKRSNLCGFKLVSKEDRKSMDFYIWLQITRGGTVPKFDQQKRCGVSPAVTKPQWNSNFDGRKTTKIISFGLLSTDLIFRSLYIE